jgi:hypothetical protein
MKTPIENIKQIEELLKEVKSHCMCAKLLEDEKSYTVMYPEGFIFDGCRISKGMGKIKALELLLIKIEKHWKSAQF